MLFCILVKDLFNFFDNRTKRIEFYSLLLLTSAYLLGRFCFCMFFFNVLPCDNHLYSYSVFTSQAMIKAMYVRSKTVFLFIYVVLKLLISSLCCRRLSQISTVFFFRRCYIKEKRDNLNTFYAFIKENARIFLFSLFQIWLCQYYGVVRIVKKVYVFHFSEFREDRS